MEGNHLTRFFLEPKQALHRQYEALRAVFVDTEPLDQVALRFGYTASTLRSMASRFRATCGHDATPPFFARMDGDGLPAPVHAHSNRSLKRPVSLIVAN